MESAASLVEPPTRDIDLCFMETKHHKRSTKRSPQGRAPFVGLRVSPQLLAVIDSIAMDRLASRSATIRGLIHAGLRARPLRPTDAFYRLVRLT